MRGYTIVSVMTLLVVLTVVGMQAAEAVTRDVPANYLTIQAGIDAASDGDTVRVAAGTYNEQVDFNGKNITLTSTNPLDPAVVAATIIHGPDGPVIRMTNGETRNAVVTGFTITMAPAHYGSGIGVGGSSPIISHNVFTACQTAGVEIYYVGTSPLIEANAFNNNQSGIFAGNHSAPDIQDNTFNGNSQYGIEVNNATANIVGNAIANTSGGNSVGLDVGALTAPLTARNNTIKTSQEAGIWYEGGPATFTGNLIVGNHGPGIHCTQPGSPVFANNTLYANGSGGWGNLVCVQASSPVIRNCIIANAPVGGGITAINPASNSMVISYCDVYGNAGGNYLNMANPTGTNGNISVDPLFVDAAGGNFHLKSCNGHATAAGAWVKTDTVTSLCLDAGPPSAGYLAESTPNGGRINMGYDANTPLTSRSSMFAAHTPKNKGVNIARSGTVTLNFVWPMNAASVQSRFSLKRAGGFAVAGAFAWPTNKKMIFTPNAALLAGTEYTATVTNGALRLDATSVNWQEYFTFTTGASLSSGVVTAMAQTTGQGAQITVQLASASDVQVSICNMAGREVAVLGPCTLQPGLSTLLWDGRSTMGTSVPGGMYLVQVQARNADGSASNCLAPLQR